NQPSKNLQPGRVDRHRRAQQPRNAGRLGTRATGSRCGRSERKRLLSLPRGLRGCRLRPRFHSVPHTGGESKEVPNKSESRRCIHYRGQFACHTGSGLPRRVKREMVVARFRRTKRGGRVGQRTTDDGKRRVQRDASKNRFPGNGPFLSTRNRTSKSSGGAELAGSGANGRAGGAGAGRQWARDQARASPGATAECTIRVRR